jgi:two-component system sensor histidine kinase CpxA
MLRPSLSFKILLVALLNVSLLAIALLIFARIEFRFDLSSFLLAPARDRIVSASSQLALQLLDTDSSSWNTLLAQYHAKYPADFYLFDYRGTELAGEPVLLPAAFMQELRHDPFAHSNGPPEHEPHRDEPGPTVVPPPGWRGEPPPHSPPHRHRDQSAPPGDSPLALMRTSNPIRYWVGIRIPIWRQGEEPVHATLVWQIRSVWTEPFFFHFRPWLSVLLTIVLVSVACWLPLIRGLTHAISRLTAATGQIANGQFDIALQLKRKDELGRLSESISRMAHRLAGLVNGQKRFLSDIAHELSSPLARMQVGLGILEQRAEDSEMEYVSGLQEETEHMSGLVNELLNFSKSRVGIEPAQLSPVALADLVEKVIAREGNDDATFEIAIDNAIEVLGHYDLLFRAVANVVRNAIRYAGSAGPIHISASRENEAVLLRIADNGPGLPAAELENVFRPFYRPEFARQRETGGVGLGLAIVRDCIESCGGSVECRNRVPTGLEVVIRLQSTA